MNTENKTSLNPTESTMSDLAAIKILVVEDDKINQFLSRKILLKMGFTVDVAGNSDEAIQKLNSGDFQIVLMDLRLPGKDGIEITRMIRLMPGANAGIPVFAITSSVAFTVRQEAEHAGINEYFTKPINADELKEMILKYVSEKS